MEFQKSFNPEIINSACTKALEELRLTTMNIDSLLYRTVFVKIGYVVLLLVLHVPISIFSFLSPCFPPLETLISSPLVHLVSMVFSRQAAEFSA